MPTISLSQLLAVTSEDEAMTTVLAVAGSLGFPVTAWQEGNPGRTLCRIIAKFYADGTKSVARIAGSGFLGNATGVWLKALAQDRYKVTARTAGFTVGLEALSCAAGAGPYAITPGSRWFQSLNGLLYSNLTGGTIKPTVVISFTADAAADKILAAAHGLSNGDQITFAAPLGTLPAPLAGGTLYYVANKTTNDFQVAATPGGSAIDLTDAGSGSLTLTAGMLVISIKAESPGAKYNVANNSITKQITPLPGVTASNPDQGNGVWWTTAGSDDASPDEIRATCDAKWATIAAGHPGEAYEYWAREASVEVTRVKVDDQNPDGPGTMRVYLAGPGGGVSPAAVSAVQAYLNARKAKTAIVTVSSAANHDITVAGRLYVQSALASLAAGTAETNVDAWLAARPIGGDRISAGAGYIFFDILKAQIASVPGTVELGVTAPIDDVLLGANEVATWTNNLTIVPV